MAIAAVPRYLGNDFSSASPGMRFGYYLRLWGEDERSHEPLWGIADQIYRERGPNRVMRQLPQENKVSALKAATTLNPNDSKLMQQLGARQQALAVGLDPAICLTLAAQSVAPFTTGLGNEHPLENGFAFLNPYGLPYLPGSGVKGVLRQAARELISGEWGEGEGWDEAAIEVLFGRESEDGDTDHQRGVISFWDVIPQIAGQRLQVEMMTPHSSHYYQQRDAAGSKTPHDSGQPNPISFLSVPPGSGFTFHLVCHRERLQRLAPHLLEQWQPLMTAACYHAFDWLGFGAKGSVGYGAMRLDAKKQAAQQAQQLAKMSPEQQQIAAWQAQFDAVKEQPFKPGSEFDQQRWEMLNAVQSWQQSDDCAAALALFEAIFTWSGKPSKPRKGREDRRPLYKSTLEQLRQRAGL